MLKSPLVILIPSSFSFTLTLVKSSLPVFVTFIVYSITSPASTFESVPILITSLSTILFISVTVFSILMSAVGSLVGSVSFPPTVATFVIFSFSRLSMSTTSTVNSFWISPSVGTTTFVHVNVVFPSTKDIFAPSADINFVPVGTLSSIIVSPSIFPVFFTVIVYFIVSPTFAVSTIFPFLVISLDLWFVITAVSSSLLSSPFAIAAFVIVPVSSSLTFTVNWTFTFSPAFTLAIHFTPITISSFIIGVPSLSTDTKVVFAGILSVISIFFTSSSPVFSTVITYVISWFAYTKLFPASVIASFTTFNFGSFTFKLLPVAVISTSVGFHQSQ